MGYRGELDWLTSHIDADYFLKIRDAIITAADELKAVDGLRRSGPQRFPFQFQAQMTRPAGLARPASPTRRLYWNVSVAVFGMQGGTG